MKRLTRKEIDRLSLKEKEAYIISIQAASTQALMRDDFNSPALWSGTSPQVLDENGNVDLNVRHISEAEYDLHDKARRRVGAAVEETRTLYLTQAISDGRISAEALKHSSLHDGVETKHVLPTANQRESAIQAWMGTLKSVKERFKEMMGHIFKPQYAEIVAEGMKKLNEK